MALALVITNAGRQALIDGETITHLAIGTSGYTATATATALQNEVTRVAVAGSSPVSGQLQIQAIDESTDVYACKELGLITDQGTLFALYAQASTLIEKSSAAALVITADMAISSEDTANISFGNTNFLLPAASTSDPGVVQLENSYTNTSQTKAPTANALKLLYNWVGSQLSGKAASSHGHTANDLPDASTSGQGVVQLDNSYTNTSQTKAPTANALRLLYNWVVVQLDARKRYIGSVTWDGSAISSTTIPSGFSVSHDSTGHFTITHNLGTPRIHCNLMPYSAAWSNYVTVSDDAIQIRFSRDLDSSSAASSSNVSFTFELSVF